MKKIILLGLFVFALSPSAAKAVNAQAQEYDELGMALYSRGLYAKSITYFQNAVQADPTDWQDYENLGNAYFKINDNADALNAYQKSLQINGNNDSLQVIVQNLQSNGTAAASPANQIPAGVAAQVPAKNNNVENEQPIENNQYNLIPSSSFPQRPTISPAIQYPDQRNDLDQPKETFIGDMASINRSKVWFSIDLAYNWSNQADLFSGAANENSFIKQNGFTGTALADHGGIEGGLEIGFLLNPYNGIAIGVRGIASNQYNSNLNLQDGGDFESVNVQPFVVPLTVDYYLFLPDHDGRFFITAGVGYYFANVSVDDNFSYSNSGGPTDEYLGSMGGGNFGFQVGIGREFEIDSHLGLRLFARGRYCKITDINGYFTSADGAYDNYGLMVFPGLGNGIGVDSTSNIGANGEHYATLDYSGCDVGVGLTFF